MADFGLSNIFGQIIPAFGAVNDVTNPVSANSVLDREYNANREDTQYQRLRQDLSAAGLNNWLAVNGAASPSAQALSNTSEAASRSGELGFRYNQLLTDAMKFTANMLHTSAEKNADRGMQIAKTVIGSILSPRIF